MERAAAQTHTLTKTHANKVSHTHISMHIQAHTVHLCIHLKPAACKEMNRGQMVSAKSKRKGKVISLVIFCSCKTDPLVRLPPCDVPFTVKTRQLSEMPLDNQEEEMLCYYQRALLHDYWLRLPITLKLWLPRFADSLCVFSASWKQKTTGRMLTANWNRWLEMQRKVGDAVKS